MGNNFPIAALAVIAAAGWGWAFWQSAATAGKRAPVEDRVEARERNHSRPASRSTSTLSLARLASSPRSAKLFAHLAEIAAEAVPGEPNEALLAACYQTLQDPDYVRRSRDFSLLLEMMRPEDAARIHERFIEMDQAGNGFGEEYGAFATRWGEVDPQGALTYLIGEEPTRLPAQDLEKIARSWGQADPAAALRWMDDHPEIANTRGGWASAIKGWIRTDPDAAAKYLFSHQIPQPQVMETIRYELVEKLYGGGLADAVDWLASLSEEGASGEAAAFAWNNSQGRLGALSPENAAMAWSRVGGRSWMNFRQFANFTEMIGRSNGNPGGVAGYLDALGTQWQSAEAAQKFKTWYQADQGGVKRWLNNAPQTAFTQAMKAAVADGSE